MAAATEKSRVQWMGDRVGLFLGVDADPLAPLLRDRLAPPGRGDGPCIQQLDAILAHAPALRDGRARVDPLELRVVEAAEVLPGGVPDPARDHLLVGQAEGLGQSSR